MEIAKTVQSSGEVIRGTSWWGQDLGLDGFLVGRFARIDSRFEKKKKKKTLFCESTFQKMDSSEDWTRITRI